MTFSVEESQLWLKIRGLILDYGDRYWHREKSAEIIKHIEEGLKEKDGKV